MTLDEQVYAENKGKVEIANKVMLYIEGHRRSKKDRTIKEIIGFLWMLHEGAAVECERAVSARFTVRQQGGAYDELCDETAEGV